MRRIKFQCNSKSFYWDSVIGQALQFFIGVLALYRFPSMITAWTAW